MGLFDHIPSWSERRPAYSTVPTTPTAVADASPTHDARSEYGCLNAAGARPRLSRFLADFTLGFADGLTVPFALTAGLSSLGKTNTVIYAGIAEVCAGCISMGIGGYLAANGEQRPDMTKDHESPKDDDGDQDEEKSASSVSLLRNQEVIDYIAPLQLPPELLRDVIAHVESLPETAVRICDGSYLARDKQTLEPAKLSPLLSGLSVALGYLLGGLLPLAPYFFVESVTEGLIWSFGICVVALFIFGFTKECVLRVNSVNHERGSKAVTGRLLRWNLVKYGLWEGARMIVFGSIAAVAAVLCVSLFEGVMS
ncbi:putative vacuolar iron transporter protein [Rosellinia necatrix]|uniref:Putative vacuolar iron transporter protein n=1 Tax=Rosellinia necatrix TaxID=77044 RepID=A0A1S8A844_ROSNE|nr:putative vacuolar iron transporter protein [Rosellinia necatrix]